jgi:6,7-dimethyl-8-ribityllumazine synthase
MPHILIVEARFYDDLADELARGTIEELKRSGATFERVPVPGVLEIPAAIKFALNGMAKGAIKQRYDGAVALGCVIRGETTHYDIVSNESARALMDISVGDAFPLGNGIQTVENDDQAWARARVDQKNKGGAAAKACLAMIDLKHRMNG